MKNFVASIRSKYLFFLGVLDIGIGVASKKVISYPTKCSLTKYEIPINSKFIGQSKIYSH